MWHDLDHAPEVRTMCNQNSALQDLRTQAPDVGTARDSELIAITEPTSPRSTRGVFVGVGTSSVRCSGLIDRNVESWASMPRSGGTEASK